MNIEVIAIGNEILSGFTINSNAAFISHTLLLDGLSVTRHSVLPDDPLLLKQGLDEALRRNSLVITTGGLGPTCDDISRKVAADLFQSDFHFDESLAKELEQRYGQDFPTLIDQATVPTDAIILKNNYGTAPGFIFRNELSTLVMLPGVPTEMKSMFTEQAIPYLKQAFPVTTRRYVKRLHLFNMRESTVDPYLRELHAQHPEVEFGIYPALGLVGVTLSVHAKDRSHANALLEKPYAILQQAFGADLYHSESGNIEEAVHNRFIEKKLTLSAAESCTGGHFSARLTLLPGASKYFLGSIISYSNALKTSLLDVPVQLIREKGAVSEEVAIAMVQGLLKKTQSDYGVAVTGIAGPTGGTTGKPVGTVWCAIGKRGDQPPHAWQIEAYGNREMILTRSVNALLAQLLIATRSNAL